MILILNLTQHSATPEQIAAGVVDLPAPERAALIEALTFGELPERAEVLARAEFVAELAASIEFGDDDAVNAGAGQRAMRAMIGGAPFFMSPLEAALQEVGIIPLYAFSVRESVEETQPDGTVRKTAVFRHAGFVEVGE